MKTQAFTMMATVAVTTSTGLFAQREVGSAPARPEVVQPSAVVSKLEEIVSIRERILQAAEQDRRSGRAPDDGAAEVALAEARVELALERNQPETVARELQNLVNLQRQRVERAERMEEAGEIPNLEVDKARADLWAAEIRLLRASPVGTESKKAKE